MQLPWCVSSRPKMAYCGILAASRLAQKTDRRLPGDAGEGRVLGQGGLGAVAH